MKFSPEQSDLQEIKAKLFGRMDDFRNAEILILGARGFIGSWLSVSLAFLNRELGLDLRITGIVRRQSTKSFLDDECYRELTFESWNKLGDSQAGVTHVFHCATNTQKINGNQHNEPEEIIELTLRVIETLSRNPRPPAFIHLSSGAVYGSSARTNPRITIERPVENSSKLDPYGRLKLKLEELIKQATEMGKIRGSNPRLFSLAGPGLHLNSGYALPTFIDSARKGFPIIIEGNPDTQRTYLYPTDLVERLIVIGTSPDIRDIQIGARRNLRMIEIANKVGEIWGVPVKLENTLNLQANYYCPDENNEESELDFEEILIRWKRWLESGN